MEGKRNRNKQMTLKEAVEKYLPDGASFTFGGIGAREPAAVAYEIIRQKKRDLTLITATHLDTSNIMIGAGCIKRIEMAYCWIGVVGNGLNLRRAVEKGIPRKVEIVDYSNFAASCRFLAGAMNIPYLPIKSLLGSDIPTYNNDIKITDDPYSGEKVALVPAANPDVAFIHVQKADVKGNCQIWGILANDVNIARAAKKVVITCEEIITTEEIRKNPNATAIPFYCVDAVVQVPFGCHPLFVAGKYWSDIPFRRNFMMADNTQENFEQWLNEWVYGVNDFEEYLDKVGKDNLAKLVEMELDNYNIPEMR